MTPAHKVVIRLTDEQRQTLQATPFKVTFTVLFVQSTLVR